MPTAYGAAGTSDGAELRRSETEDDDEDAAEDRRTAHHEARDGGDESQRLLPLAQRVLAGRLGSLLLRTTDLLLGEHRDGVRELRGSDHRNPSGAHQHPQSECVE